MPPTLAPKIRRILSNLNLAKDPRDLQLPRYRLHALSGDWGLVGRRHREPADRLPSRGL